MPSHYCFLLGMIGASAPEILRLYALRRQPPKTWSNFYVAVSLVFAALGGVVALILPATTPWAAFYAGISTPTLVTTGLRKASAAGRQPVRGVPEADADRKPVRSTPNLTHFLEGL